MATKTRSRHLKDSDIEAIVELLDGWDGDVTWKDLCDACGTVIGFVPTRQTLNKFSRIIGAYKLAKERAKEGTKELKLPPTLAMAAQRIDRLTREVERLERENTALLEQFVVWQYNAHKYGLSITKLNEPMSKKISD